MEVRHDYRPWDELIPDILGLIFKRLPLNEILNVVPSVCKSWANATRGPYCWQEIDIEQWSQYLNRDYCLDRMLLLLIGRSSGTLQKLCVYGLGTEYGLSLIGDNANNLRNLQLPSSKISNSMVEQVAGKLTSLTYLDLSYCMKVDAQAIEVIGKHCKKLTHFLRNMNYHYPNNSEDAEAFAIATTMLQLKHLEINHLNVTTKGVLRILTSCHELELLDVRGCFYVKLDEAFLKKRSKLKVAGPQMWTDDDSEDEYDDYDDYFNVDIHYPSNRFQNRGTRIKEDQFVWYGDDDDDDEIDDDDDDDEYSR